MPIEVGPMIYQFTVTLPNSPLRALNAYVIKTPEKSLLIDTGFNHPECLDELLKNLAELEISMDKLEVLITHLHVDHGGLAHYFEDQGCKVYASTIDGKALNANVSKDDYLDSARLEIAYGMNKGDFDWFSSVIHRYRPGHVVNYLPLNPGDTYEIGPYHFQVVDLIGHTPGHIGLYEADHNFMFSGDTVLDPISPNITYWENYPDILGSYIKTLKYIDDLKVDCLYAAHRQIIDNPHQRIHEIIDHHHERLDEVLGVMKEDRPYTIREISAGLTWKIRANHWDEYPPHQKWFASGEAYAHIDYLVQRGQLVKTVEDNIYYFSKVK